MLGLAQRVFFAIALCSNPNPRAMSRRLRFHRLSFAWLLSLWLTACGAQWRSLASEPPAIAQRSPASAELERVFPAHGHRDFPQAFALVWPATVEVLHTHGIGVPRSARPVGARAEIDLDGIHVLVEARYEGRVCVILRFRALEDEPGKRAARAMLDEIQARLGERGVDSPLRP